MKTWLDGNSARGFCSKPEVARRTKAAPLSPAAYVGRQGIVMWVNFWGTNNQGDHIDLWDGSQIAHGDLDYFGRSAEVHFWQVP